VANSPSIMVRVLGDLTGLNKAFADATTKGQQAAGTLHTALSGTLAALNQTGVLGPFADALAGIDTALDTVTGHAKAIGPAMIGVGGALAGVGAGLAALGSKDQAAHQQLQASVEATGKSYDDYSGRIEEAIKHQEKFGDTANQTQDALRVLTQATGDPTKALDLLSVATDLAAAKHETLDTAATQLGRVYNGNTKILKEFGITGVKGAAAVSELSQKLSGQGAAAADTFSGKVNAIKAHLDDVVATFGQKYGPAITAAGSVMAGLGGVVTTVNGISQIFAKTQKEVAAVTDAATAAAEGEQLAFKGLGAAETGATAATETHTAATEAHTAAAGAGSKALGLLKAAIGGVIAVLIAYAAEIGLVLLVLAALAAIAYVIYRNWGTIFPALKAIVKDTFDWIKNNWPLLVGILTGGIGLAAGLIVQHWNDILHGAQVAFKAIANAFVDAINFIIRIWNDLHFKAPGFSAFGVHVGGFTIGLPHIPDVPHLDQGGLITRTGLIFAHAGETVTPAPPVRQGPAIVINDAHFSSDIDIELFLRRAAWTIQTQKI
jgi:hypothetical protein